MKNVAESVKAKLHNLARSEGRQLNALLEEFALARLFARLSRSRFSQQFILKGAQLFTLWTDEPQRPTRDADFLSFGLPDPDWLASVFDEICQIEPEPADGLEWTPVQAVPIREDNIYGGVRIKFFALLKRVKIPVQVDVGFGDSVTPEAMTAEWQMPFDYPPVPIRVYCPETSIAEKLQAAVVLETGNSRLKDFFDLYWLGQNMEFDGDVLREAIVATFEYRNTPLPKTEVTAFTETFYGRPDKNEQWKAFVRKSNLDVPDLMDVIEQIACFLNPVLFEDIQGQKWNSKDGWLQP